ncbi:helix-turn-helix transcriptional regulator [Zhouia spongiae]|uniref:Helix-turn-helix transcriptional regulator n=1 Tax=Zhouia spongiae TaxID=2202721 RepID=A0ABY3YS18_9FLAO|nr:helix-turn-helix domain-containing protein [Zhouia spongiae]UNZ00267.1 helix-turn-helix transcriptional regulator [Zhouia spongiae]
MQTIKIKTIKEPNITGNFSITHLDTLLAEKDMTEKIHRHDFFFLLAITGGTGKHQIDFTDYPVLARDVFVLRPGQVHQLYLKKGTKGYLIAFDTTFYAPENKTKKQAFRVAGFTNHYHLQAEIYAKLQHILDSILNEYTDKKSMYEEHIKVNLDLLFIILFRQRKKHQDLNTSGSYNQLILDTLSELLETHIISSKQVRFYAEKLHLTPYQLNTITKNALGKTCSGLITEQILLEAKRMLLATSIQVKEIAYDLGYEDASYFIRFFKKHTGHTPESFRKNLL